MPFFRLFYHIIWGTKNREPIIFATWEEELCGYIWGKSTSLECLPHAINGMPDHLHLLISIPPKLSISNVVGKLKGTSSRYINQVLQPGDHFSWQSSYGVISVSESHKSKIINYIENQKHHHHKGTITKQLEFSTSSLGAEPPSS